MLVEGGKCRDILSVCPISGSLASKKIPPQKRVTQKTLCLGIAEQLVCWKDGKTASVCSLKQTPT